jgi:hypothetical protein
MAKPVKSGVLDMVHAGINVAWAAEGAFGLFERALTAFWSHVPVFTHAISVGVAGGPNADLRRCWYLACAVAFGRMKRSPALRGGAATMEATWDVTGKIVKIELMYQIAKMAYSEDISRPSDVLKPIGAAFAANFGINPAAPVVIVAGIPLRVPALPKEAFSPTGSPLALIQLGPDQISVGGGWPGFLMYPNQGNVARAVLPERIFVVDFAPILKPYVVIPLTRVSDGAAATGGGFGKLFREWPGGVGGKVENCPYQITIPGGAGVSDKFTGSDAARRSAPTLPDDGRVITTGEKHYRAVQPPKPAVDGATRSSVIALVAAELASPCFLPPSPEQSFNPIFSSGARVYPAGSADAAGGSLPYSVVSDRINALDLPGDLDQDADGLGTAIITTDFR